MSDHCAGCTGTDYIGRPCRGIDIAAVRASSAQQERERLRAIIESRIPDTHGYYWRGVSEEAHAYRDVLAILSDPEPQP